MASPIPTDVPSGNTAFIGIPDSEDIPRLVYCAPYFTQVPLAELIEPSVVEAVNNVLPSLVPPYVDAAAQAAVQAQAVLLVGSTMSGPLFLSPLMPTQPSQAATMAYVDSMIATAGIPEVPPVPSGQVWARETGQWVPITPQTGVFLPLSGGSMVGNINMSGNTIQNMAAVPAMPNGAAPAQWVLNQIASVSLYQGTWNADTNVPDLTQLSTHVNAYTWIALTSAPGGVVIGPAIPGLQGQTVFNGDTIIYSTVEGGFKAIHGGGITLPEADGRFVQLAGSQMSGALLLNANASQPLQAVTLQQLQAFVPPGVVPEAPNDGQLYGRNGLTTSWHPVLPLAGGILTGAVTLAGNATANLNPVPLQQMSSAISAATAPYLLLAGGTMTGLMTLSGNATVALNPVPLQQLNAMLASYAPLASPSFTGNVAVAGNLSVAGPYVYLGGSGGTGNINGAGGPLIYADANSLLFKLGSGNQSFLFQSYAGAPIGNLTGGGALHITGGITSDQAITLSGGNIIQSGGAAANTFTNQIVVGGASGTTIGGQGIVYNWIGSPQIAFNVRSGFLDVYANGAGQGSATLSSDAQLKENIAPATVDCLAALQKIEVQQFDWKDAPDQPHWNAGLIAQQVQTAILEAAPPPPENMPMTINLLAMIAYLVGAVQQLADRLATLEARPA